MLQSCDAGMAVTSLTSTTRYALSYSVSARGTVVLPPFRLYDRHMRLDTPQLANSRNCRRVASPHRSALETDTPQIQYKRISDGLHLRVLQTCPRLYRSRDCSEVWAHNVSFLQAALKVVRARSKRDLLLRPGFRSTLPYFDVRRGDCSSARRSAGRRWPCRTRHLPYDRG